MYRVTKTPSGVYAVDMNVDTIDGIDNSSAEAIDTLISDGDVVMSTADPATVEELLGEEVEILD